MVRRISGDAGPKAMEKMLETIYGDGPWRDVLTPQSIREVYGIEALVHDLPEGPVVVPAGRSKT